MMSLGGGGYGGGGLPAPSEVFELWGGTIRSHSIPTPAALTVVSDDGSGPHDYSLIAIGPQGRRTPPSPAARAKGLATLRFGGPPGADSFIVQRDGREITPPVRIEGSEKTWTDK
jgi:hypothetical protein